MPSRFRPHSGSSELAESTEPLLKTMATEADAKDHGSPIFKGSSLDDASSVNPAVGRDHLYDSTPPHVSYEGFHRYDPSAKWTLAEENAVVRKTDLHLLTWICLMVRLC